MNQHVVNLIVLYPIHILIISYSYFLLCKVIKSQTNGEYYISF